MLHKIVTIIYNLLTSAKNSLVYNALFLFLIVSPIVALAFINYTDLDREITKSIIAERRALSVLAATTIRENLDNLKNLGIAYATRPRLIAYIEKGDWESAVGIMAQALQFFPHFDRIVLFDPDGVIKEDLPHAISNVIGQSRADTEWYSGLKRRWKPYVSGVYTRGAEPKIPVVSVVVPIRTIASTTGTTKVIGILQLQVRLDIFSQWATKVDIGPSGIIYIVDQFGRLVYHPKYLNPTAVTDFSSVGIVSKLLNKVGGAEVNYNPIEKEERLAAYEPVSPYGWGVVITQPTGLSFLDKNKQLRNALITYSIMVILAGAMAFLILFSIFVHKKIESEKEALIVELKEALTNIKVLQGLLPICASCKKIRNDKGYWEEMELYIRDHSEADFSHGICPDCIKRLYPQFVKKEFNNE
jgi:hypothetical protein